MARNRQRAKERQARRRAQQGASGDGKDGGRAAAPAPEPKQAEVDAPRQAEPDVEPESRVEPTPTPDDIALQAGAPPEDVGRSDEVLDYEPLDTLEEEDHYDLAEDEPEEEVAPTTRGPRGRRGEDRAEHKDRPRFIQFLIAVVAELRRVQWPDRQATTTLTGVVLGFVLIAGGYLGLLDAIFSRIIKAIL